MVTRRAVVVIALALSMLSIGPAKAAVLPPVSTPGVRTPCSVLDTSLCLLPFPNNHFTAADPTTDTKLHVDFQLEEMPRNLVGKPIDPSEWNRNDGFSPGSMAITFVPGLDLRQTWNTASLSNGDPYNNPADHLADIGRYLRSDAPIAILDTATGERWPFWSELDMNAGTPPDQRLLILRPAKNFLEGHTYQVVLRNMKDASGNAIAASPVFAAIRDNVACDQSLNSNADEVHHTACLIQYATEHGFPNKSSIYLTWDFTIASARNLAGRVLHIRDDAFEKLGRASPTWSITSSTEIIDNPTKQRSVEGTITVPNYLVEGSGTVGSESVQGVPMQAIPGGRFLYGPDGLPMQNPLIPTIDVPFVCTIPKTASASDPAFPILYGHGLLGSRFESTGGATERDRENNLMPCAVNWMGFASQDVVNAVVTLQDPSNMASMMDRAQQGFLNFMFLGRALKTSGIHGGLSSSAAFQDSAGNPLFKSGELAYDGNSQGGIMGGALTALEPDLTRSTLGVTGMNYSTLLNRSVDWEGPVLHTDSLMNHSTDPTDYFPSYSGFLYTQFPNKMEQQLVMALLQMLWDRGEADGYAEHMTTQNYPHTPKHTVLMHVAVGDFQVTNFSAEVEARTIGAHFMDTSLAPGRHWTVDGTVWGLPSMPRDSSGAIAPFDGSTFVYWDSGNYLPPNANIPPRRQGGDPHEDPRRDPRGGAQKATFYRTGEILDVLNGAPYLTCSSNNVGNFPRVRSTFSYTWCATYPPS